MPSSSNNNTFEEKSLFWHYKLAYLRLRACRYGNEANIVTDWYSDILERPGDYLKKLAWDDARAWNDVANHADKMKEFANIGIVGGLMADAAGVLARFGRNDEAKKFGEYADEFHSWSKREEAKEAKWRRSS